MPPFTIKITTSGNLISSFVFTDTIDRDEWMEKVLPKLESQYGKLRLSETYLPGLRVGDKCRVVGEGADVFTIMSLKKYSDHRFGFCLDSGWCEEVAKCYEA